MNVVVKIVLWGFAAFGLVCFAVLMGTLLVLAAKDMGDHRGDRRRHD